MSLKIREIVQQIPATVLTDARQVRESTLLQHDFPDFRYCTLDDHAVGIQARFPETVREVLVHGGDRVQWFHPKVIAVPWRWLDLQHCPAAPRPAEVIFALSIKLPAERSERNALNNLIGASNK